MESTQGGEHRTQLALQGSKPENRIVIDEVADGPGV